MKSYVLTDIEVGSSLAALAAVGACPGIIEHDGYVAVEVSNPVFREMERKLSAARVGIAIGGGGGDLIEDDDAEWRRRMQDGPPGGYDRVMRSFKGIGGG